LRILFLSPRQCWPPLSGAKLREYHFLRALGRRAEMSYLYFAEPDLQPPSGADLDFCRQIVVVPQPRLYSPLKLARGLLGRWPLTVVNYTSTAMRRALVEVARTSAFDVVHIDIIHMAGYEGILRRILPGARIFYNWHNIESELMRRYSEMPGSLPRRVYARVTARKLAAAENRILHSADGHVVCSERERALLQEIAPQARIEVIGNGVDTRYYSPASPAAGLRDRIVFVGSMSYHANIAAAQWFAREIWPRLHDRFPRWKLTLVGSNPVPAVRALESLPGVEVTGTVPDVRPFYIQAVAAVAPLRTGSGTRLKILEAMAAGVPVVSTALGAEGLALAHGKEILIADTAEQWMDALASLAGSRPRWESLSEAGRAVVEHGYDWDVLGRQLYETYRSWLT
jgi:sugar transferase (PEP-CTERM/EpsH1 system associated)